MLLLPLTLLLLLLLSLLSLPPPLLHLPPPEDGVRIEVAPLAGEVSLLGAGKVILLSGCNCKAETGINYERTIVFQIVQKLPSLVGSASIGTVGPTSDGLRETYRGV